MRLGNSSAVIGFRAIKHNILNSRHRISAARTLWVRCSVFWLSSASDSRSRSLAAFRSDASYRSPNWDALPARSACVVID